jgi:diguanylate cyclase (GGDEF)-like protein
MSSPPKRRSEEMWSSLNQAAVMFLSQREESFRDVMTVSLKLIADALALDRISVWRNFTRPDGLRASQIYRWDRKSGGTTDPTTKLTDVLYSDLAPRWEELLGSGGVINSPAKLLPESELLLSLGVVSVYVAPVFIHDHFWGFVLLEDCCNERFFDDNSAAVMRSAAFLCTNTVITYEKKQNEKNAAETLLKRNRMLSALNKMSVTLLSHKDESLEDVMTKCIRPLSEAAGIDRVAVFKLLDGKTRLTRIFQFYGEAILPIEELPVTPQQQPVLRWLEYVSKGDCVNADVSELPKEEAATLGRFGIKAILCVPIFTRGKLWGIITLEDHTNYRHFDEESLELLRSAAHIFAGAIVRAEMEKDIAEKTTHLSTISTISAVMLQSDTETFDDELCKCMGMLGEVAKVDRVCLCKNRVVNKKLCYTRLYEWSQGVEPQEGTEYDVESPYRDSMAQTLSKGRCINSLVRSLPAKDKAHLKIQGVLSILMVPLFLRNHFWGFVGFKDCGKERHFLQSEEDVLRSATHLIANALLRYEETNRAKEADDRARLMLDSTPLCCHLWDEDLNVVDCNSEAIRLFDLKDKQEFIDRFHELSPKQQPDSTISSDIITEFAKAAQKSGREVFEWTHQKLDGEPVPTEKTLVNVDIGAGRKGIAVYTRDLRMEKGAETKIKQADARNMIMFDAMPLGCIYWNDKAIPIDCNDEVLKLFMISSKQEFCDRFLEFSPDKQPNGSSSSEMIYRLISYAFYHGKVVFEWMHKTRNDDLLPTEISLIKVKHDTEYIVVSYIRDLSEIKEKSAKLDVAERLAFSDTLTGIRNRRYFMQHVLHEFSAQKNISAIMGIILFDIDHFKRVNDTFGHDCGDEALKMVAAYAQSVLRESDLLARFGGEEFIVLVQNLELQNLARLARRILKRIESMKFIYNGEVIPITVSAGVAIRKDIIQAHTEVIKNADNAMYRAKANGRNRVEIFDE